MTSQVLGGGQAEISRRSLHDVRLDLARRVMAAAFGLPNQRPFAVRYWSDGYEAGDPSVSRFTLVIREPRALRRTLLLPSELALGEAFINGDLDVEGDLEAAGELVELLRANLSAPGRLARLAALVLRLPGSVRLPMSEPHTARRSPGTRRRRLWLRRHSRGRDAAAIRHHYDVGNEFYRLWLDPAMVYSCAYYPPGVRTLAQAQQAKLDYICRKLHLEPGERLLDIGCGWGALIRHAARHYGVEAVGITLSRAQAELAARTIAEEGLEGRCRVEVRDYRDLPGGAVFDKVASVGMFEHVGKARLPEYFAAAYGLLRPGGLFLNHGIIDLEGIRRPSLAQRARRLVLREGQFLGRYVFPDGELVPFAVGAAAAEGAGFETRDVESLREHYVLTLREWVRRLETREREAVALVGALTYRIWRLYMAISAHSFATGRIGVVQHLLAKPGGSSGGGLCTRHDLYVDCQPNLPKGGYP